MQCGRGFLRLWACAARGCAYPAGNGNLIIAALRARGFAARRSLGRLRGARALLAWCGSYPLIFLPCGRGVSPSGEAWDACAACDFAREARSNSLFLPPCGRGVSPPGEVWDACAARGKAGPVMGLRPLRGPPCIPPEAPPKRAFNFRKTARARVLRCGSFPPSLRSLR